MLVDPGCEGATWGFCASIVIPSCNAETEYQQLPVVIGCDAFSGSTTVRFDEPEPSTNGSLGFTEQIIATLPWGIPDVQFAVLASFDVDVQLLDLNADARCVLGRGCLYSSACAGKSDFCISYKGMAFYFSGDGSAAAVSRAGAEVVEELAASGPLKSDMSLVVRARHAGVATITYSWGGARGSQSGLGSCQGPLPGCEPCSNSTRCSELEVPHCDGSSVVSCHPTGATTTAESTNSSLASGENRSPKTGAITGIKLLGISAIIFGLGLFACAAVILLLLRKRAAPVNPDFNSVCAP